MTIHHDKMAYGRLSPLREDFSEDKLEEMAKKLSQSGETREKETTEESTEKENKRG